MSGLWRVVATFSAVAAAGSGCARGGAAEAPESRAQWLRRALLARDQAALARGDADKVAGKYARMARNTFAFYRGISWSLPREPSRYAGSGAAAQVAVIGDPHPENVGSFLSGGGVRVVDFNDFDQAGHGPYTEDLRRLALALWIAGDMADVKKKQRARVVAHTVEGYLTELRALAAGQPGISLRADTAFGGDLEDVLVPADEDEAGGEAVSPEEDRLVRALVGRYPATLHEPARFPKSAFAIKRIARRHLGVSSFPMVRYRVGVEGPSPAPADDWTLELKESPAGEGRPSAATIVALQRRFQEFPDDDPLLGWAAEDKREFRVRRVSPDQRRIDVERIVKQVKSPRWGKKDFRDFAAELGRLLARGHARGLAGNGKPGLEAIAAAVGTGSGLHEETGAYVAKYARQTEEDLDHFRALIKQHGPLLGWQPPAAKHP